MKKVEADVIVIAGGLSGLAAAISAAEQDAGVIVFEKSNTTGGAANMGMGLFAAGSRHQKNQMIDFTPDDAFKIFMEYTHWRVDARLVRKYYDLSANTVEWLESMGVEFLGAFKYYNHSNPTWHIVKVPGSNVPAQRASSAMVKTMTDRAEELGVQFHYKTPVKKILIKDGRASGVIAVDEDGEEIVAECDCIIIATGGFGDNPDMIRQYTGFEWGRDLFSFRIPGVTGDGIRMAWEAGAGKTEVGIEMTYNSPGVSNLYKTLSEVMRQPNLMVNLEGKRFFNEELMNNTVFTGNAIARQTKRCGFSIIDDNILNYYKKNGLDYFTVQHNVHTIENWDRELAEFLSGESKQGTPLGHLQNIDAEAAKGLYVADSIDELAEMTGIDTAELKAAVEEYNKSCRDGDRFFNKSPRYLRPITGPRYYACKQCPAGYGSLGGIKINDELRVLTHEGKPIPGLYACGTDACSIFGDSYCFALPGSTMGFAVNSGRMAGRNAVSYLDSDEFDK
jgi:fumarate reductase flavoprotein subunit